MAFDLAYEHAFENTQTNNNPDPLTNPFRAGRVGQQATAHRAWLRDLLFLNTGCTGRNTKLNPLQQPVPPPDTTPPICPGCENDIIEKKWCADS